MLIEVEAKMTTYATCQIEVPDDFDTNDAAAVESAILAAEESDEGLEWDYSTDYDSSETIDVRLA